MSKKFPIVGIGASAGGLEAFEELLRHLPGNLGMAFIFVQHLAPRHPSMLAELLLRSTKMPVCEVKEKDQVKPDHIYIIPPNTRLTISRGVLHVTPRKEGDTVFLPVDGFFSSLAKERRHQSIGVILSGNANDGTLGLQAIKAAGGITFAQDKKTAKFDGMPRNAIDSGSVDFVLTPQKMAKKLEEIARHPQKVNLPRRQIDRSVTFKELQTIFGIVKRGTGVDFSLYKRNTILRRMEGMFGLRGMTLEEYVKLLRRDPSASKKLMEELLIHVTGFFRDPSVFKNLKKNLFPKILRGKNLQKPCRIWVPGCSNGEEAYSIAISLMETLGGRKIPVKIFGTDISDLSIEKARRGFFNKKELSGVSTVRLRHFFTKSGEGYEINRKVRDLCVFGKHDLIREPPFSNIDFISCRNLFVYLGPILQEKVVSVLHYALRPNGFLLLGKAETLRGFPHLFEPADQKWRLYAKKRPATERKSPTERQRVMTKTAEESVEEKNIAHDADRMMREELQAANEELRVANEELQNSNEELETTQEELQSTNEELTTLNEEIQNRNVELQLAKEFSDRIIGTIREPLLILDRDIKVVRANEAFYKSFNLTAEETEKKHLRMLAGGCWNIPALQALLEEIIPQAKEISNFEVEYDFPVTGHRTLLLNARKISKWEGGAPMILVAIDLLTMENRVVKKIAELSEKEKQKVGRNLHDGLGQSMTGIALLSKSLEKRLGDKGMPEFETAAKITKLVKQGVFEISRMARGLVPITLESVGFIPALAKTTEQVKTLFGIDCAFECKEEAVPLSNQNKINLYYIAQEAINNAIRHGKAKKIRIQLERHHKELLLSICDNGLGLPENFEKKDGMGLRIMQYRASEMGANIEMRSGVLEGTVITVRCPLTVG